MPKPSDADIANIAMTLPSFERMGDDMKSFETADGVTRFEYNPRRDHLAIRGPASLDLSAAVTEHYPYLKTAVNPSS